MRRARQMLIRRILLVLTLLLLLAGSIAAGWYAVTLPAAV